MDQECGGDGGRARMDQECARSMDEELCSGCYVIECCVLGLLLVADMVRVYGLGLGFARSEGLVRV